MMMMMMIDDDDDDDDDRKDEESRGKERSRRHEEDTDVSCKRRKSGRAAQEPAMLTALFELRDGIRQKGLKPRTFVQIHHPKSQKM